MTNHGHGDRRSVRPKASVRPRRPSLRPPVLPAREHSPSTDPSALGPSGARQSSNGVQAEPTLSPSDFRYLQELVRKWSGNVLESGKEYLAELRLSPIARELGLPSVQALLSNLQLQQNSAIHQRVVETMTTNETFFFRDKAPFDALQKTILPSVIRAHAVDRKLNVWCSACSTGQEPYSIALLLHEYFPTVLKEWTVRLIASDLSSEMIARAKEGVFSATDVKRGLPESFLLKYFTNTGNQQWQIRDFVRARIEFRQINLVQRLPLLPLMDVIFLRNVLIYFSVEQKKTVLGSVFQQLRPGGYLALGNGETAVNLTTELEQVKVGDAMFHRRAGLTG